MYEAFSERETGLVIEEYAFLYSINILQNPAYDPERAIEVFDILSTFSFENRNTHDNIQGDFPLLRTKKMK